MRVGVCQTPEIVGAVHAAVDVVLDFAGRADRAGVDLLLFPECFLPGYVAAGGARLLLVPAQNMMRRDKALWWQRSGAGAWLSRRSPCLILVDFVPTGGAVMTEFPEEVRQRLLGTPEQDATRLVREPPNGWRPIVIEDYDPAWAGRYDTVAAEVRGALADRVLGLEHVGSTSVPGLAAKAIIDVDLVIAGTDDESAYVPALEKLGYVLVLREPWWHGHRMFVDPDEDVHLHVWPLGSPEVIRHRLLRDWLRTHPEDRELYASTKRRLAREADGGDYSMAKSDVIDAIFERIFAAGSR